MNTTVNINRREALRKTAMLMGAAVSASALAGLLQGCKTTPELTYTPKFFSEDQGRLVTELAEIILPKTDTPGAKDVGVPQFIDTMLKDCYKKEDQDYFLKGLTDFDNEAKKTYGDAFIYCKPEQQVELVKKTHDAAVAESKQNKEAKRPFILTTKELTLIGFFTSEPGATQVLQYEAVPGAYHGCVPLAQVGKAWAT